MKFTEHAQMRINQRGISPLVVDLILEFGEVEYHRGNEIYRMSRKAERRLCSYLGDLSDQVKKSMKEIYVVAASNNIVTVARKAHHLKRNRW